MTEVLVAREGGFLTITLDRPEVFNAFSRALHVALRSALEKTAHPPARTSDFAEGVDALRGKRSATCDRR